jgi:putative transposase
MPRRKRFFQDGLAYHVLNRGNKRSRIFLEPADYESFLDAMATSSAETAVRHLTFCLMTNHWHLVLLPEGASEIPRYMQLLMNRHIPKHQTRHGTRGTGHIYQGPYKCFPIEGERHLLAVCRYVEANPVRAGLVNRAEDYRWSGLTCQATKDGTPLLSPLPVPRPGNWLELVNTQPGEDTLKPIRESIKRVKRRSIELGWTAQPEDVL